MSRLKARQLDPEQVALFAKVARFLPGRHRVTLFVNGIRQGNLNASFNTEGQLCFDALLMETARLLTPEGAPVHTQGCNIDGLAHGLAFSAKYPQTVVELRPGQSEVHLIVPAQALRPRDALERQFDSGGFAGLLNYNFFTLQNTSGNTSTQYRSLATVLGANAGDWLFRSNQNYTASRGYSQLTSGSTYAQRTFSSLYATAQGGQININSSVYSGIPLLGLQIVPEESLRAGQSESPVRVEGIAPSEARVEIRQNDRLVHTSVVAQGPFLLTGLDINRRLNALVSVIENTGATHSFTLPAASLDGSAFNAAPGYSLAVGQYRPGRTNQSEKPVLISASGTWPLTSSTQLTAGLLGSANFQGASWSSGYRFTQQASLSMSQSVSRTREGQQGTLLSATISTQPWPELSLALGTSQQTRDYREFQDTLYRAEENESFEDIFENGENLKVPDMSVYRNRSQYNLSLGWASTALGRLSLSTSYSQRFNSQSYQLVTGSWSAIYKKATFSAYIQSSMGNMPYDTGMNTYLNVSIPFGDSVRGTARMDKGGTRTGVSLRNKLTDSVSYQMQMDHNDSNHQTNFSASTTVLPRYTQASLGYSRSSEDASSHYTRLSGAVVAHRNGVTLSPYSVDDTFSVVSVGDLSGIKISTPQGPVWTDVFGQAIASRLTAHSNTQLTVNGASLPRNVELSNGVKQLNPSRGSVNHVEFDVLRTRRALLIVTNAQGTALPKGLAVMDEHDQYVTTSIGNGKLYFPSLEPDQVLNVVLPNAERCRVDYVLPKQPDPLKVMETIEAQCRPVI